jgi:hypothetical protein
MELNSHLTYFLKSILRMQNLFFEEKVDRAKQQHKANQMIPAQPFSFKKHERKNNEHRYGDYFLEKLELPHVERSAHQGTSEAIGRNHETIFNKRDPPADENVSENTGVLKKRKIFVSEMSIPGQRHEGV